MWKRDSDERIKGKYRRGSKWQKGRGGENMCNREDIKILLRNLLSVLVCVCVKRGVVFVRPSGAICVIIIAISTCQTLNKI